MIRLILIFYMDTHRLYFLVTCLLTEYLASKGFEFVFSIWEPEHLRARSTPGSQILGTELCLETLTFFVRPPTAISVVVMKFQKLLAFLGPIFFFGKG